MTGIENYNFDYFNFIENILKSNSNIEVVNPVNICKKYKKERGITDKAVFDMMVADQQSEEMTCNAILLLNGWEKSGVRLELRTALENNMKIYIEQDLPRLFKDADANVD